MQLYIGNKNYSSWSLRPWLALSQLGIPFEEVLVYFDDFGPGSPFKKKVSQVSPVGRVPVLVDDGFPVWDTLAIVEYAAEKFPQAGVWPADRLARARARSVCAEMHAGFGALRNHCPMNLEADLSEVGARIWREHDDVRADLQRIEQLWADALGNSGGPFLFGAFSAADAYFAPVVMRIRTYRLPVSAVSQAYLERILALPAMKAWLDAALAEHRYVAIDEPYRSQR